MHILHFLYCLRINALRSGRQTYSEDGPGVEEAIGEEGNVEVDEEEGIDPQPDELKESPLAKSRSEERGERNRYELTITKMESPSFSTQLPMVRARASAFTEPGCAKYISLAKEEVGGRQFGASPSWGSISC